MCYLAWLLLSGSWLPYSVSSVYSFVVLLIILDYRNALYSAFMPIISPSIFDNQGKPYDVTKILTPDFLFDKEAFQKYSPIYLPVTYFLSYGAQFAGLTALLSHTLCFHGKEIWQQTIHSFQDQSESKHTYRPLPTRIETAETINYTLIENPTHSSLLQHGNQESAHEDIHNRLMERYDDVPIVWYLLTLVSMLIVSIFVVE